MSSFALQLAKFAEKTKAKADDAVGLVVVKVAAAIDKRSPVGDGSYWISPPPKGYVGGRFRGNWQLGVGFIPSGETGAFDKTGEETQGRIIATIPQQAAGKVYYLQNNVPYAQRIEEGWSRQAPQGVVGLVTIQWQQWVDAAVAELSSK